MVDGAWRTVCGGPQQLGRAGRRLFATAEARAAGHGGIAASSRAARLAAGLKHLDDPGALSGAIRRPGSGRHAFGAADATLLDGLRRLLEPATMGDPMRPLLWVSKSHAKLADALRAIGHQIGKISIPKLLGALHHRRQVNRKTLEGSCTPDRDAQFDHISAAAAKQAASRRSPSTPRKKLVGSYKNAGSDYRPQGGPDLVRVHDFVDPEHGKAVPFGGYDIAANASCVSVGIDNDTAQFAVNSIRHWLDIMGQQQYPGASRLMIMG